MSEFGTNKWKTITHTDKIGCMQTPTFITTTTLATAGCGLLLASTEGETLMSDRPKKHQSMQGKVAAAKNGTAFAVASTFGKGGGIWDRDTHVNSVSITVYTTPLRKPALTLEPYPLPNQYYDFALSPDGSKLAILSDGNVAVYALLGISAGPVASEQ